jgi:hypothetical protein
MENQKKRPKFNEIEVEKTDLQNVLGMALECLQCGRPATYPETAQGLQDFKDRSRGYFAYLDKVNSTAEPSNTLIPDIEGYCSYLGISRQTLLTYEKTRGEEWQNYIQLVKTCITSTKKQLAFHQKIPTVLAIFDLCNNSNYVNSSEFKLEAQGIQEQPKQITASQLPILKAPTDDVVTAEDTARTAKILTSDELPKL